MSEATATSPDRAAAEPRGDLAIDVRGLVVRRGPREVLHGLDLQVPTGQVVGLLGPSGGGKSTLMRAVVGVQVIHGGEVLVLGRPAGSPALRREVGYTTQAPSIYDDLSVRANVTYFARLLGAPDVEAEVDRVLDLVDLTSHADDTAGALSGGQRGRASLACSLVGRPRLLVLDEPTVGLDPVLRRDLWELFHRLAAQGATLLVSSHVMDEAARCDRLVLIRDGRILADATCPELLAATGADDAEQAFLALIDRADAGGGVRDARSAPRVGTPRTDIRREQS
ncbi:ABC transporter ATP-binding protein [Arsenicicoccus dermatophilus]|uniref:ABC transporter ATP-binding protein n=1 Tax=Arsenicicoccus dermatophilus TaxID=1076331 RepID=UPI001F4CDEEA|nr:ABC transporter ATP-binding protein [Arsenicicoccus dermatophilus]MCH8613886.1 ABC transporter ATP-binding protein [Arsenicicoccus dermatophilus]